MSFLDKVRIAANKTADALENGAKATIKGTLNTVEQLREEGLKDTAYDLGNKLGATVKSVSQDMEQYVEKIENSNKKVVKPVGISFKSGTLANTTTKGVIKAINTIRIVSQDANDKLHDLTTDKTDSNSRPKIK